jgi:hypothetical protein
LGSRSREREHNRSGFEHSFQALRLFNILNSFEDNSFKFHAIKSSFYVFRTPRRTNEEKSVP